MRYAKREPLKKRHPPKPLGNKGPNKPPPPRPPPKEFLAIAKVC